MAKHQRRRAFAAVSYTHLNAAEDKKRKEEAEVKNNADNMVYQSEKALKDAGDKATAEEKAAVEKAIEELKKAIEANNVEDMKAKTEALTQAIYPISAKMYQEAQAAGEAGQAGGESAGPVSYTHLDVYKRQE